MPLDKDDYRVHWVASDCSTCIAGITDAGVLETLGGLNIDVDFATGEPIVVDIDVPLASDVFVTGIDVDLQQSAGYTDSWSTAGGIIGIRGDVHVDYVITDVYGVYGNVYIDPAATCTVNDAYGLYGTVTLVGPFTAGAATSEIAAIKGEIVAASTGSYDGRVYGLMLQYDSTVNYGGVTALIFGTTAAGAYCDYGMYVLNASPNMTAGILIDDSGAGSIVTGISVAATCTTAALQIGIGGTAAGDVYFYSGEAADNYFRYNSSTGKFVFGGVTDWGTGATGVLIDGAGYDWVSQTIGHIDANLNNTAAAAAYYALTVGASQTGSNSCFGTWTELYISNSVDLTGADNFAAVWGQVEAGTGVTFSDTGCFTAGLYSNVIAGATLTVASGHSLNGVRAQIEVAAITNSGKSAAFECLKNGGVDWDYGIYLADVTTGIYAEGKMVFGGVTDWGTGATGTVIDGTGYDWVSQTVGRVNANLNSCAAAAAYYALSVTASQTSSNSCFGNWIELYVSNSVDLTGADNFAAVWGQFEAGTGVTLSDTGCFTAGLYANVKAGATMTVAAGHAVNGVRAQFEVAAITNGGRTAAFECLKGSGVNWEYGLYIADTDIAIQTGVSGTSAGDVFFYGDLTSSYVQWDASEDRLIVQNTFAADGDVSSYEYGQYNGMAFNTAITTGKIVSGMKVAMEGTADYDSGALVFPLWIDIQNTGTNNAAAFYMARFSVQSGACLPNAYIQFQTASPGVEWLFAVDGNVAPYTAGGTDCTASGATDPKGTLAVRVPDGSTAYIRVWAAK